MQSQYGEFKSGETSSPIDGDDSRGRTPESVKLFIGQIPRTMEEEEVSERKSFSPPPPIILFAPVSIFVVTFWL